MGPSADPRNPRGSPKVYVYAVFSPSTFIVWKFPLPFVSSNFTTYWRRFGVDLPGNLDVACEGGCPVIVDFHGSGGSVYTQREWTNTHEYQNKTAKKFILVTVEGSPDLITFAREEVIDTEYVSGTSWNVLGFGNAT